MKANSKRAAIDELLAIMVRGGVLRDVAQARQAVWKREQAMSTGMRGGLAMPHGRTDAVSELVCAVGVNRAGLDFGAIDGEPGRIFVLTLSPRRGSAPDVQFMVGVAQILNEEGRQRLLACETPDEMLAVLNGAPPAALPRQPAVGAEPADVPAEAWEQPWIRRYIRADRVKIGLTGRSKEGVIEEMLELLNVHGQVHDVAEARRAILAREAKMSTGMPNGIAIPHARTEAVDRLICAVGIAPDGIDFEAADGEPSRIFIMTLSPTRAPGPHLQLLATISRALDAEGRARLLQARGPEEVCAVLEGGTGG
ncbi:MAG: PTS sugar transporter subunit IIA [Kiritimatiellae bacterium]|nr:PTS sugar transporter subunit IIA [Kiritimatiellia bacterium]